jgi:sugar lactone lactonase YvrE
MRRTARVVLAVSMFAGIAGVAGLADIAGVAAAEKPASPPVPFGERLLQIGSKGTGARQMTRVMSVAADSRGSVYAADRELGRIQRFDAAGKLQSLFYFDGGEIDALACDRAGILYVLYRRLLVRYDPATWTYLGEVESPAETEFRAIAPGPDGGVIALRTKDSVDDIVWLDKAGKVARTRPDAVHGVTDRSIEGPLLATDSQGNVFVGDEDTHLIYKFDRQGRFVSHFQFSADAADSSHENLHALAIDHHDRLWVGGWGSTNIFAADGRFLGQLRDLRTSDLAIGEGDEVYSAELSQVSKYAAGQR